MVYDKMISFLGVKYSRGMLGHRRDFKDPKNRVLDISMTL